MSARSAFRGRRTVLVVVAACMVAAGTTGWAVTRSSATTTTSTDLLVAAVSGTQRQVVTASGTIQPARRADLTFSVPGTVTAVPVAVGQAVTAGQALATVDPSALNSAVATAQAAVTAAQASLAAEQAASASTAQLAAATAQVASANTKLAEAQGQLADATLTSTITGTVAAVSLSVGDRVSGSATSAAQSSSAQGTAGGSGSAGSGAAGGSGSSGNSAGSSAASGSTETVTVISTDAYVVQADVQGADLARVSKGLQAEITPTGATARVFGTVASIGIVASAGSSGAATFPVVIDVTGNPGGLYAGGTASVVIIVSQVPDVLTVPTLALHTTAAGTVVYQRRNGSQVSTPVTVGLSYGPTTQILRGLTAGEQVVVPATRPGAGFGGQRTGQQGTGQQGGGQQGGQRQPGTGGAG